MKIIKLFLAALFVGIIALSAACGSDSKDPPDNGNTGGDNPATYCDVYPIGYSEVNKQPDMEAFYNETRFMSSMGFFISRDTPLEYGFVEGVWHKLKVAGKDVPVYSARCGNNVHSFAWVDVDTDGDFSLNMELTLLTSDKSAAIILPEKKGVKAEMIGNIVTAELKDFGSYSIAFDDNADKAITLYVAPKTKRAAPDGWNMREFEPGKYTREETTLTESNTLYYFKQGVYDITSISIPSDSIVYFENGTYIRVYEASSSDYYPAVGTSGTTNVTITGRAIVDFSACMGGDAKYKSAYDFSRTDNLTVKGLITINSHQWTMVSTYSNNVNISECMFFSYRTYADGIAFIDCKNSTARNCFVRTGDDAIEIKAFTDTTNSDCYTDNILIENNCVWTDKGIGYGSIYEAKHDVRNVVFKNNSIGFAQASWSDHLGCFTVQMGSDKNATWSNIRFEDMEVYKTSCAVMSVFNRANNSLEGGKIKDIYFKNITVKSVEVTKLPVYALSVVIRLLSGATWQNSTIGALYLDNIMYLGELIDSDNLMDYTNIDLSDGAKFTISSIKVNTL